VISEIDGAAAFFNLSPPARSFGHLELCECHRAEPCLGIGVLEGGYRRGLVAGVGFEPTTFGL